jgi:hypothetical protein
MYNGDSTFSPGAGQGMPRGGMWGQGMGHGSGGTG